MKTKGFQQNFDDGCEGIVEGLDLKSVCRSNQKLPAWMIAFLDREACRIGVTRQSIIKVWLAERLETVADRTRKMEAVEQG